MEPLNNDFHYTNKKKTHEDHHFPGNNGKAFFKAGSVSIPVLSMNRNDGERLRIRTGDMIVLETPHKKKIKGKAFLTEEIMPGVIKVPFGPGGQNASGLGFINNICEYTPNINELYDPGNFNPYTGTPGFGDIMVKVIKT